MIANRRRLALELVGTHARLVTLATVVRHDQAIIVEVVDGHHGGIDRRHGVLLVASHAF
jgi:hypothetical protein